MNAREAEATGDRPSHPDRRLKPLSMHAEVIQLKGNAKRSDASGTLLSSGLKKDAGKKTLQVRENDNLQFLANEEKWPR